MRYRARRWINLIAVVAPLALAPGLAAGANAATVLRGTIAHAPSGSITLRFAAHERRTAALDSNGAFSLALEPEPKAPLYVQLELRENLGLMIYLRPGETVSLECDATDPYGTARFRGGAVAENEALAQLSRHYDQADYRPLFARDPAGFEEGVASLEKSLAAALGEIASPISVPCCARPERVPTATGRSRPPSTSTIQASSASTPTAAFWVSTSRPRRSSVLRPTPRSGPPSIS
jgi:hypothetical protein